MIIAKDREMTHTIFNALGEAVYTENIDSGRRWSLTDVAGKPIYRWDNRHFQFRHTYDSLQRPLNRYVKEDATETLVEKTEYGTVSNTNTNRNGKLFRQYDQSGFNTIFEYDFKGNPVYLRKRFCEVYDQTIDWDGSPTLLSDIFNTEISYDAMNRPAEIIQPDASVVAYAYNKAGLLETVQAKIRGITTYTEFVTNIDYNEKGQRTAIYYRNGSKTAYTYDDKSFRLTRLLTTRNTGQDILQDISYTYDAVGNITEVEDDAQQTFYYSNSVIAPRGKYWYDALYRLTKATGRELASLALPTDADFVNNIPVPNTDSSAMQNFTQEYRYDELGNIEQMRSVGDWTRNYYYETVNNRLKNHDGGNDVYSYDEHGNCTEMPHLPELDWDYKDELKEVTLNASNHKAYYTYDASGERVRKVVDKGSVVEERLYIGGFEIYRKTISGTLDYERETLKITEGRNTIAQLETKTVENSNTISTPTTNQRFQYSNHLGSACLELDENADIISYEEYHPFGTTSYRSGSSETEVSLKRYKYVGKERDEETGLYYYGARYYAAWIARFVSVDPLQFEYAHLNPYNYAGNKPIIGIDLDGLQSTVDDETLENLPNLLDEVEVMSSKGANPGDERIIDGLRYEFSENKTWQPIGFDIFHKPQGRISGDANTTETYPVVPPAEMPDWVGPLKRLSKGAEFVPIVSDIKSLYNYSQSGKLSDLPNPAIQFIEGKLPTGTFKYQDELNNILKDQISQELSKSLNGMTQFGELEKLKTLDYTEFESMVGNINKDKKPSDKSNLILLYTEEKFIEGEIVYDESGLVPTNVPRMLEDFKYGFEYEGFRPNYVLWGLKGEFTGSSFPIRGVIKINYYD
ncbi:MAG: hypothetical protein K9H64_23520 [Bacteroidales bacterium]|nr:hypothetical protein [Bacteroidales bacterium]MCF8459006.1 hypothetical protein [Bacteroidales bacterium]